MAGGTSRRMGVDDKCLLPLGGKPVLSHIIERIHPQIGSMVLNANGDAARFAEFGLPVVTDAVAGNVGPLAGVLTGLEWGRENAPDSGWVVSLACDAPFLPTDMVARLVAAVGDAGADMACAASGGRDHPVFGLWPVGLAADLRRAVVDEGIRKVDLWTTRYHLARVEFDIDAATGIDPFFNLNGPDDMVNAEALLAVAG
jgi:molybdopterin-guanine dinucleotide biosynthesis protein A